MNQVPAILNQPTSLIGLTSTADEIMAHVHLIQDVMKKAMKEGQHWGTVPGCGDKPALLKPGAEKILELFRLASDIEVTDKSTDDCVAYRVKVILKHQITGNFIGSGIGECSSDEEKYRWRGASNAEWNETPENRRREKWRGKENAYKIKQVRTNPADVANTVLKMAKKRALVDAALTATSASDIFAQDIEETIEDVPIAVPQKTIQGYEQLHTTPPEEEKVNPADIQNVASDAIKGKWSHPSESPEIRFISVKQAGRFYAIAKGSGATDRQIKDFLLAEIGSEQTKMIPSHRYDELCSRYQSGS